MKKVRYIGPSHVRILSAKDLKSLGIEQDDPIEIDTRKSSEFTLANDKAEALMASSVKGEFEILGDAEETAKEPELDLKVEEPKAKGGTTSGRQGKDDPKA